MAQSYFIWNNVDCRAKGVTLAGPVPIVRPEERVKHVQIPGISGDLTQLEGENIFNSYIQTANIQVAGGMRVREIYDWLRGSGYVTFHGEPDRRQAARIIGAITLNRFSRNIDRWTGSVQFYCQPLKERLRNEIITVTSTQTKVYNFGDVNAKPIWRVTADNSSSFSLMVLGTGTYPSPITVECYEDHVYMIDSEVMEIMDETNGQHATLYSSGPFPFVAPGGNMIIGSGWSRVEIEMRERFL